MKKIAMTLIAVLLTAASASAAVTEIKVEKDFSNNSITINGKAAPSESVTFQILPEGITLSQFAQSSDKKDEIAFIYEDMADEKGDFSVTAKLKSAGKYNVFVASADVTVPATSREFAFYTASEYDAKIAALNAASTEADFISIAKANKEVLGFDEDINSIVSLDDILKRMYQNLGGKSLDSGECVKNTYIYRNSFAALALNNRKITSAYDYVKNIIEEDSTLKKYWEQYITDENLEKELFSRISGKNIGNISDLKTRIEEGLILTATKHPNGYMSLQGLYTDYRNVMGIANVSSSNLVYNSVASKDYTSIADLKKAYDSAVLSSSTSGSGGSGGGGGGGSSSISTGGGQTVTSGQTLGAVIANPQNTESAIPEVLPLLFKDLAKFEWAYPSISILYEAGIVSGMSEEQFAPAKQVKREEFIKMIVCAMELEPVTGYNFTDVDNNAWYAPFVYAAYENKLVNGISETEFGVSKDIKRQDMAVMIYNAIKARGYLPKEAELSFDDGDVIDDYAKEAVSQLVSLGIINGMGNNLFAPKENATRAQAAVIIERALKYLKQ